MRPQVKYLLQAVEQAASVDLRAGAGELLLTWLTGSATRRSLNGFEPVRVSYAGIKSGVK